MIPITASTAMAGAQSRAVSGRMGMAIRMKAYEPSFRRMAARSTDPTVGAAVWASGSQVWKGHIGTFTAKPKNIAPNTSQAKVPLKRCPRAISSGMSKVDSCPPDPDLK